METLKITEVQTSDSLDGAHLLVTRPEPDGEGGTVESLRRVDAVNIANCAYVDNAIDNLRADLTYKAISGTVSISPSVAEWGSEVTPTVSWSLSKIPATLIIGEATVNNAGATGSFTAPDPVNTPGSVTVVATDERGAELRRNVEVAFSDRIYHGGISGEITAANVKEMSSTLKTGTVAGDYRVQLSDGDVICFATTSATELTFYIGANEYDLSREMVEITNAYGVAKTYYVYRSGQPLPAGILTLTVR